MRNRILGLLATTALSVGFGQSGSAADLPKPVYKAPPAVVVAAYNWTGFYVGAHGGGAWAHKAWGDSNTTCLPGNYSLVGCSPNLGGHTAKGILGGVQAGINFQADRVVFGIEGQFSFANLRGSHSINATKTVPGQFGGNDGLSVLTGLSTRVRDLGTIAGRLGVVFGNQGNTLLFGKGGAAFADDRFAVNVTGSCSGPCNQNADTISGSWAGKQFRWGWMAGAGVEHKLDRRWSIKAEYNFLDLGRHDVTLAGTTCTTICGASTRTFLIDQNIHLFKVGVNYQFGS